MTGRLSEPQFQHYWRCAHHPIAIKNFFEGRTECEWECHLTELKWYHSGVHPTPKSWGTPRFEIDFFKFGV